MNRRPPRRRPSSTPRRPPAPPSGRVTPRRDSGEINIPLILATIAAGAAAWLVGMLLYPPLSGGISRPPVIGGVFVVLYILLAVVAAVFGNAAGSWGTNILTHTKDTGSVLLLLCAGAVVTFGLGALFQWIYGLDLGGEPAAPTSYIFVIDDSGSMETSDHQQERYAAIPSVLEGQSGDFPYMVYSFADNTVLLKEMAPISDGIPNIRGNSNGQTEINGALNRVIDDYTDGVWEGGGAPKVILLTDGGATDIDSPSQIKPVLDRFVKAGISVSTVGLGMAEESLLQEIAGRTGGVYIDIAGASELPNAMASAATRRVDRDLLSARAGTRMTVLYGILRVVFLTILGTAVGLFMAVAYGRSCELIMISSAVKSFLGAFLMEVFTAAGVPAKLMWLILWLFIALTLAEKTTQRQIYRLHTSSRHE